MLTGTHGNWHLYLLAPPASGETMVQFFHSGMFSLIHLSTAGSAYKLSTGISKNPWNTKIMVVTGDEILSALLFNKQTKKHRHKSMFSTIQGEDGLNVQTKDKETLKHKPTIGKHDALLFWSDLRRLPVSVRRASPL